MRCLTRPAGLLKWNRMIIYYLEILNNRRLAWKNKEPHSVRVQSGFFFRFVVFFFVHRVSVRFEGNENDDDWRTAVGTDPTQTCTLYQLLPNIPELKWIIGKYVLRGFFPFQKEMSRNEVQGVLVEVVVRGMDVYFCCEIHARYRRVWLLFSHF